MEFQRKTFAAQPYLYVDCDCEVEGPAIAAAMGDGFGRIMGFMGEKGITPTSMPMSIYHAMPAGGRMAFQCAMMVPEADAAKAEGPVRAATLPAGDAMTVTHVGPYDQLNKSHGALWDHMQAEGIPGGMPVWEIYVDDPGETPPERLRTEIYRAIGGS